jgi:hypothetical protein
LVADKVRPNAQTTVYMAAHGCHLSTGCLFVLLVIIKSFFLAVRDTMIARTVLYKVSIAIVSRCFYEKTSRLCFDIFWLAAVARDSSCTVLARHP